MITKSGNKAGRFLVPAMMSVLFSPCVSAQTENQSMPPPTLASSQNLTAQAVPVPPPPKLASSQNLSTPAVAVPPPPSQPVKQGAIPKPIATQPTGAAAQETAQSKKQTISEEEVSQPVVTTEAPPPAPAPAPAVPAPVEKPGLSKAGILSLTFGGGVDFFAQKRMLDNAGVPFVALGYNFTNHWGAQMFYGNFNTDSQNALAGKPRVHGAIFAFDGVYHFASYKTVEPYLLFGVGIMGLSFNNNDANNQGNINAGLGLQYFINNRFSLSVEGRDFYTTVGGKNDILLDAGVSILMDVG